MPRTSFTAKLNSSVHIRSVIKRMTYSASLGEIFTYRKKKELSKQEDKLKQRQKGKKEGKGDNDISRQSPKQM